MALGHRDRLHVPETVQWCEVGGEAVLLDTTSGRYFGLNPVGARMWELLGQHGDPEQVVSQMITEFDVDEGRLRSDLEALVETLIARGLLRVVASQAD